MDQEYIPTPYTQSRYTIKQKEMVREQMAEFEERPLDPNAVPIRRRGPGAKKKGMPTPHLKYDYVWDAYEYDPETGVLRRAFWHVGVFGELVRVVYPRPVVVSVSKHGYTYITFRSQKYTVHRLAWRMVTGEWPERRVRHLNGLRFDNRWSNLALSIGKPNGAENSD